MQKSIETIIYPTNFHMVGDGFKVHSFFPSQEIPMERMSPFLLYDYMPKTQYSPTKKARGVGVHPHRGFETLTFMFHGSVSHHDSSGNSGTIWPGDIQWMTAGEGILHKEYHSEEFTQKGGMFQGSQIWVNLPSKDKMTIPKYQAIEGSNFEVNKQGSVIIKLLAGEFEGENKQQVRGPAETFSAMKIMVIEAKAGDNFSHVIPSNWNSCFAVIDGEIETQKNTITENGFVLYNNDGEDISIDFTKDSRILFLSGEDLKEPIESYGPFVMNTREEIIQAVSDFNMGKMGVLEE